MNKHILKFSSLMAAFAVLLGITMGLLDQPGWSTFNRALIGLLPSVPLLLALRVLYRKVMSSDEMHIKIQKDSVLRALMLVCVVSAIIGLLEIAGVIPAIPLLLFPLLQ